MRTEHEDATCFCHTCGRWFHWLGIARHRTGHLDQGEDCTITYTRGNTHTHHALKSK